MNFYFTRSIQLLAALFFFNTATAQVFWSEDFANGLPSTWTNEDLTSQDGEEVVFVHTTDINAIAAPALGNEATSTMMSSTADNGYIYANSDRGLAAAPAFNHTTQLTTDVIDCSGQDNVYFRVESVIGVFEQDASLNALLQVSTDGMAWTDYTLFSGLTTSVRWSDNPAVSVVNLTEQAANQSTVYLRFYWFGGWEYFWAIDDISLTNENPLPPNDLSVNSPLGDFYAIAPNAVTPASQVEPFGFLADVANVGSADQTDVNLNISIFNTNNLNTPIYTEDLSYGTIPAGGIVENELFTGLFTPEMTSADYLGRYTISSAESADDANPDNNEQEFVFAVSDNLFSKELGATRQVRPADSNWGENDPRSWAYGNCFYMPSGNGWNMDYVEFGLGDVTGAEGQQLTIWLYKWTDDNSDALSQETERERVAVGSYEITGNEGDDLIQVELLNFLDNSTVIPFEDDAYYLLMLDYAAPDNETNVLFQASEQFDYSAMNFRADSLQAPRYAAFLGINETEYSSAGFGLDIVPVVRMYIQETVNNEEILTDANEFSVFPNPAFLQVNTLINLEEKASNLAVQVMDINGRLMAERDFRNVQSQAVAFDVQDWADGTYLMRIVTEQGIKTQKFMVQK